MVLFLAGAVPLSFALVVFGYAERRISLLNLGRPAARGLLMFVVAYVFYLLLRPVVKLDYSAEGLYIYYLLHDSLYFLVWSVVSYLVYYQIPHTDKPEEDYLPVLVYFTSFYLLLAISDILLNKSLMAYIVLLLPVVRVGLIYISVAMIVLARRMYMVTRYALLLIPFTVGAAAAFVPALYTQRYIAGASLLAAGIFVAGALSFVLSTRK